MQPSLLRTLRTGTPCRVRCAPVITHTHHRARGHRVRFATPRTRPCGMECSDRPAAWTALNTMLRLKRIAAAGVGWRGHKLWLDGGGRRQVRHVTDTHGSRFSPRDAREGLLRSVAKIAPPQPQRARVT